MKPSVSVIIPAFNRVAPLRQTLQSALAAADDYDRSRVDIILVDDGSTPPLAEQLSDIAGLPGLVFLRQANAGSIEARLHGLRHSSAEFILFLDSDDLIHPQKLALQVKAQVETGADISYSDQGRAHATPAGGFVIDEFESHLPKVDDFLEFLLKLQPAPHTPIYRRDYLVRALAKPLLPSRRPFDPAGDVWLYYNLLPHPATLCKVDGPFSAVGIHAEIRYSLHWEKLGVAALLIAEGSLAALPSDARHQPARAAIGRIAFDSWRHLPPDFSRIYQQRLFAIWRNSGSPRPDGGRHLQWLARFTGYRLAALIIQRIRRGRYRDCRTLNDRELDALMASLKTLP